MAEIISSGSSQEIIGNGIAYLVEERTNPSSAFFVLPAMALSGYRPVRCDFSDLPAAAELEGAVVVFIRYVPPAWARLVESMRPRLQGLVFFMDDDVLDTSATIGMPWRYRFKLARMAAWRTRWLKQHNATLWVASGFLQQKYASWSPKLVLPSYLPNLTNVRWMFYHGSASHDAEIRWLRPIMEEVLRRDERLILEISGGRDVYRLYSGVPRVMVVHPMRWPAYQLFQTMPGRHIGLAPLLDLPFNRGRSYTKFFDITRCGAVGIYSPGSVYSQVVSHDQEGLIVKLDQAAWVEAILSLAQNEPLRQNLLRNAEIKSIELADVAQRGYSGLLAPEA